MKARTFAGRAAAVGMAALLAISLLLCTSCHSQKKTLRIGIFAGSNWGVAIQDSYKMLDKAIETFEMRHPDVEVTYDSGIPRDGYAEYLSQKILKGDAPDVMVVPDEEYERLIHLHQLQKLDDWISGPDGLDPKIYYKSVYEIGQWKGVQYTLPVEVVPNLLFVNRTLLTREKISLPEKKFSFDEMYDICRRVTRDTDGDGILDQFGIFQYDWKDAAVSAGARPFEKYGSKINLASAEMKQALLFMAKLTALNQGQTVTQEDFDEGRVAFMPMSLAEYRTYKAYPYKVKKYSSFQWDCIEMPKGPHGGNLSRINSLNVGISAHSKHKGLAWEFLKYISADKDFQLEMTREMPAASPLKEVMELPDENHIQVQDNNTLLHVNVIRKVIRTGVAEPKFEGYAAASQMIDSDVKNLYSSNAQASDLDYSLRTIEQDVKDLLGMS